VRISQHCGYWRMTPGGLTLIRVGNILCATSVMLVKLLIRINTSEDDDDSATNLMERRQT